MPTPRPCELHEVAKSARNETERRRYYTALMQAGDPQLAVAAVKIAFCGIPPQAESPGCGWFCAREAHQQLAWDAYVGHLDSPWPHTNRVAPCLSPIHRDVRPLRSTSWKAGQGALAGGNGADLARGRETARWRWPKALLTRAADQYVAGGCRLLPHRRPR
jgi:aminopeptidase N